MVRLLPRFPPAESPRRVLLLCHAEESSDERRDQSPAFPQRVALAETKWELTRVDLEPTSAAVSRLEDALEGGAPFDVVLAPSCFTSFDIELTEAILRACSRGLAPGGYLVFSLILLNDEALREHCATSGLVALEKGPLEELLLDELGLELEQVVAGAWRGLEAESQWDVGVLRKPVEKRPLPPLELRRGVGAGSYWQNGRAARDSILRHVGTLEGLRLLELGCGLGRVAHFLADPLGDGGTYDGFDVSRQYVDWCRERLGLDPARFRFHHFDLESSVYNTDGRLKPQSWSFPWPDASFDLVVANSVFTHLQWSTTEGYLRQCHRVLGPEGRVFATFYLLDEESRAAVDDGRSTPQFPVETQHGRLASSESLAEAVAFERDDLETLVRRERFEIVAQEEGSWRGAPAPAYQDTLVLRRD